MDGIKIEVDYDHTQDRVTVLCDDASLLGVGAIYSLADVVRWAGSDDMVEQAMHEIAKHRVRLVLAGISYDDRAVGLRVSHRYDGKRSLFATSSNLHNMLDDDEIASLPSPLSEG